MTVLARAAGGWSRGLLGTPANSGVVEVAVVLGTRSEAVALAPVVRALRRCEHFSPLVVSTGQQSAVLDQVLRPLGVRPDVDLTLTGEEQSGPPRRLDAAAVERLGELLAARRPHAVLVHGDSATAFGAALAACSEGIGVGHLGAGLRTQPAAPGSALGAEANQRLIAPLARWHLAPTAAAAATLAGEGIDESTITVTGATGVDALLWAASLQRGSSAFPERETGRCARRVLACLHLHEADQGRTVRLTRALRDLAADGVDVVLPLHPDGAAAGVIAELAGPDVRLVDPLEYLDYVASLGAAGVVVTDSAAVEEEAAALGRPLLVVRDTVDLVRECRRLLDRVDRVDQVDRVDRVEQVRQVEQVGRTAVDGTDGADGTDGVGRAAGDGRAASRVLEVLTRSLVAAWEPAGTLRSGVPYLRNRTHALLA